MIVASALSFEIQWASCFQGMPLEQTKYILKNNTVKLRSARSYTRGCRASGFQHQRAKPLNHTASTKPKDALSLNRHILSIDISKRTSEVRFWTILAAED